MGLAKKEKGHREMCPTDVKAIQSSGLCCPSPLPPKIYWDVCLNFFALFLADVTAQRFPDLKMSPGQLWILFVVTGKCLTPGPHKKVGALKFWALKQETQTFFPIIETSFLSDFCCLKRSSVTYQFNRKNNGKPEIWRWQGFLKRCTTSKCTSGLGLF